MTALYIELYLLALLGLVIIGAFFVAVLGWIRKIYRRREL